MGSVPITEVDPSLRKSAEACSASESVSEITQNRGLEVATAVLYERVLGIPGNAEFLEMARQETAQADASSVLIGVVPGAFYQSHRDTSADGARVFAIAKEMGCEAKLIPVRSFGTLEENANTILDWLEAHSDRQVALASLSKGGADVKFALASPRATKAFAKVTAWVSFSGIVQGTPLVEWLRQRLLRWCGVRFLLWWGGHEMKALEQLRYGRGTSLDSWPSLPAHLRIVHVYGFPLRGHLAHRWAPRGYERLAAKGPNDGGGILLEDLLGLPGIVCPIWGSDHYLNPSWDIALFLRGVVTAALSAPLHASQYERQPTTAPAARSKA